MGNTLTNEGEYEKALKVLEDGLAIALDTERWAERGAGSHEYRHALSEAGAKRESHPGTGDSGGIAQSLKNPFA